MPCISCHPVIESRLGRFAAKYGSKYVLGWSWGGSYWRRPRSLLSRHVDLIVEPQAKVPRGERPVARARLAGAVCALPRPPKTTRHGHLWDAGAAGRDIDRVSLRHDFLRAGLRAEQLDGQGGSSAHAIRGAIVGAGEEHIWAMDEHGDEEQRSPSEERSTRTMSVPLCSVPVCQCISLRQRGVVP